MQKHNSIDSNSNNKSNINENATQSTGRILARRLGVELNDDNLGTVTGGCAGSTTATADTGCDVL